MRLEEKDWGGEKRARKTNRINLCSYILKAQERSHFKVRVLTYAFDDFGGVNLWPSQRHKGIKNIVQHLLEPKREKYPNEKNAAKASCIKPGRTENMDMD